MPSLTLDAEALARHTTRLNQPTKARSAVRYKVDSDGSSIGVDLPGPAWLAGMVRLDAETFRQGTGLVTAGGGGLDLVALAAELRAALAALPDRADATEAYVDTQLAAAHPSPTFVDYSTAVVRAFRLSRPAYRKPRAEQGPSTAKTKTELVTASRARLRADEEASALAWLGVRLDPDDLPATGRTYLADLHAEAVDVLEMWVEGGDELDSGRALRVPGVRVFARVVDRYLGERAHTARGSAWIVTPESLAVAVARLSSPDPTEGDLS